MNFGPYLCQFHMYKCTLACWNANSSFLVLIGGAICLQAMCVICVFLILLFGAAFHFGLVFDNICMG